MQNLQRPNAIHIDPAFRQYVDESILTKLDSATFESGDAFWNELTNLLSDPSFAVTHRIDDASTPAVSLLNPRYALKAINARWGSLYSALYHEHAIPHSAGLKTGHRYNIARGTRVITYAREFLDSAFPLSDGSHKDAISYLVYFQNLMVTLADGSTVGLKNPSQFVAKSGPKSDPDSIVLRNQDSHVEIRFDQTGNTGKTDMANIQDILVEAPAHTVVSCDAQTIDEKCRILSNLQSLLRCDLTAKFARDEKPRSRRLNRDCEFTAPDGECYTTTTRNPVVLRMQAAATCPAVSNSDGKALSAAAVDAALFSLIARAGLRTEVSLLATSPEALEMINAVTSKLPSSTVPVEPLKVYPEQTVESHWSADNSPQQKQWITVAEEELSNTVTLPAQNDAVLRAIHTHTATH